MKRSHDDQDSSHFCKRRFYFKNNTFNVRKRIKRLLFPYLVWTLIYTLVKGNNSFSFKSITSILFFGMSSMQMYFVIALAELTVFTSFLFKWVHKGKTVRRLPFLISPIYLLIIYFVFFTTGSVHFTAGRNLLPWLSYYYLGALLAGEKINVTKASAGVAIAGLLISVVEGLIFDLVFHSADFAVSQLKLSSFVYSCGMIMLMEAYHKNEKQYISNVLVEIGNVSYGIYFLHLLIIKYENQIANSFGLYNIWLPIYEAFQCVFTVAVCYAIVVLIRKLDKRNRFCWLLGFN